MDVLQGNILLLLLTGLFLPHIQFSTTFLILIKVSGTAVNILSFHYSAQMDFFKVSSNNSLNCLLGSCLVELL